MFLVPMSRESRQLSRLFDDTFERVFGPAFGAPSAAAGHDTVAARSPALDVAENDRVYTVRLDLPGVPKEAVKVSVEGRQITVQAEVRHDEEKKDGGDRVVYRERSLSSYARSFTLPVEVEQKDAQARLEHGVLTLTLPKRGAVGAAQLTVN